MLIKSESKWSLWDHKTNTYETRDHYLMRPRPRPRPITVRMRSKLRPKKWSRDHVGLETLTFLLPDKFSQTAIWNLGCMIVGHVDLNEKAQLFCCWGEWVGYVILKDVLFNERWHCVPVLKYCRLVTFSLIIISWLFDWLILLSDWNFFSSDVLLFFDFGVLIPVCYFYLHQIYRPRRISNGKCHKFYCIAFLMPSCRYTVIGTYELYFSLSRALPEQNIVQVQDNNNAVCM